MCIFCKIINHEIPSKVVYEDNSVLAILDISQTTYGHTIVMPKKHVKNLLESDTETFLNCMKISQHLAQQIVQNTHASGCNLLSNCNEAAGQTVDHMHIHIIPRFNQSNEVEITFHQNQYNLDEVLHAVTQ